MLDLAPRIEDLEPIESASNDELRSPLQLERLRRALAHAYANVAHYRASFDAAGVHPEDCRSLEDIGRFPFTTKEDLRATYPFGMFAVPEDQVTRIHASSGTTGRPTVVGYAEAKTSTSGPTSSRARSEPRAGGRETDVPRRVRLRALHRRPRSALWSGATRLHRGSGVRRHDRAAGAADPRPRARHHHGHALLHARDFSTSSSGKAIDPAATSLKVGDLRRGALDGGDARRDRGSGSTCMPSTSTACRR